MYVVLAPWRDAAMAAGPGALASIFARLANGGSTRCPAACQAVSLVVVSSRESSPLTARFVCQAVNETVLSQSFARALAAPPDAAGTCAAGDYRPALQRLPRAPGGAIVQPCPPPAEIRSMQTPPPTRWAPRNALAVSRLW